MQKSTLIAFVALFFSVTAAQATIRRVNNNPSANAAYTSIQAAHDAANAGDTIHIEGSSSGYGQLTATKQLVYIGPGYYLTENPNKQATTTPATVGQFYFGPGTAGSVVMGLTFTSYVYLDDNNLTLKRNSGGYYYIYNYDSPLSNLVISQNWNVFWIQNYNNSNSVSNLLITNNYISGVVSLGPIITTPLVQNNVLAGGLTVYGALVLNNILIGGGFGGIDNTVNNNISISTWFTSGYAPGNTYSNNQSNVSTTNLFVGTTPPGNPNSSTDYQFMLKTGSPAIGAGTDGVDIGMFGNSNPYVLSGIPSVPAVYFLNVPATGNSASPLNVTLKVRSNN